MVLNCVFMFSTVLVTNVILITTEGNTFLNGRALVFALMVCLG